MKRKDDDGLVQTAVRLPQSLHERMKRAGGERGMGEEIRRRLEASFAAEKVLEDQGTRELLDAISAVAAQTTNFYGRWSENIFAFEVLKACVNLLLTFYRPKGLPAASPNPSRTADVLFGPDDSPEDIGRIIVSGWIGNREKHGFGHEVKRR